MTLTVEADGGRRARDPVTRLACSVPGRPGVALTRRSTLWRSSRRDSVLGDAAFERATWR
ncbi:MAG: hypothetical protein U1F43_11865 [Myxococcota bacterium]